MLSENFYFSLAYVSDYPDFVHISPNSELFSLTEGRIWSLLKTFVLKANANSKVNLVSQLPSRLIYSDS
jgi:hypothetical protein